MGSLNSKPNKCSCFLALVFMFSFLFAGQVFAESRAEVYINGISLATDVAPVVKDATTYVPIRAICETLGYMVQFDSDTQTVSMHQPDLKTNIKINVNSVKAYVNGKEKIMSAPPIILDGRTLVPASFVSEALESRIDWQSGYEDTLAGRTISNKVNIYCSYPIKLNSGNAGIASLTYTKAWSLKDNDGRERTISYDVVIPQFSGMKDAALQKVLNDSFNFKRDYIIDKIEAEYEYAKYASQKNKEIDSYTHESVFSIMNDQKNSFTIMVDDDSYTGGAHGMPSKSCINVDFNRSSLFWLPDLFKPDKNYNGKLLQEMDAIRKANVSNEYEGVSKATDLPPENCFYMKDGKLVLFYAPYELSSFARGFVYFEIPLKNLSDYLQVEYK